MKRLEDIKEKLKELKPHLKEKYKVKEIGIFGSYVRGEQGKRSDIDILIEFEENTEIGLLEFIHLENLLSDMLGVKVDLVMKKALKPHIGRHILKEVIYL
ncbi:MAG: nucleotidyltransferase family protein [Bacteroidota bacterium]